MSYNTSKRNDEDFSTTADMRESKGYSTRYSKARPKNAPSLPFHLEKAATLIQRCWRQRMCMRRLYYERLHEQLWYHNQAAECIVGQQVNYLQGLENQVRMLERRARTLVEDQTKDRRLAMKGLAKECVGLTFKMEKKMLSQREMNNLTNEKQASLERIQQLKQLKQSLRSEIISKTSESEQLILREIKQANAQLLKVVSEKNSLKHRLKERLVNQQQ